MDVKIRVFSKGVMTYDVPDHWTFLRDGKLETIQDNMDIMLFTGLKDKNKVDIYGSDICESLNGCKAVVEWRVYRWVLRGTDHKGKKFIKNLTANTANHCAQVIGSIHTTPELLT